MMSKSSHSWCAILLVFAFAIQAQAQLTSPQTEVPVPYSDLKTLNGYQPSLLVSEKAAQRVFDLLPTSVFTKHSGCYQRAHYWSHSLSEYYGINSMKVFLFFTNRYHREFNYAWGFHVATLIPTRVTDGSIQDLVFDPVFLSPPSWASEADLYKYDSKPVSIHQWTRYFVYPETECPVIETYADYVNQQDLSYCFIMKTPMYLYSPIDFDRDAKGESGSRGAPWFDESTQVRRDWRPGDLDNMKKGIDGSSLQSE